MDDVRIRLHVRNQVDCGSSPGVLKPSTSVSRTGWISAQLRFSGAGRHPEWNAFGRQTGARCVFEISKAAQIAASHEVHG
jgi:hypothetical protein